MRLSQSRGVFAVIGAAVATAIFVLFSSLPGGDGSLRSPSAIADRTVRVSPEPGDGAAEDTGSADRTDGPTPGQPDAQPSVPVAPAGPEPPDDPAPPGQEQPVQGRPPVAAPPPEQPAPPPSAPAVQREKTVRLSTRDGHESVDIDSWRKAGGGPNDLRVDENGVYTVFGAELSVAEDSSGIAGYHDCARRTNWVTRVNFAGLQQGSTLCAQSRTGRYAALVVIALPRTGGQDGFVFHGTTWQLAGQSAPRNVPPSESPPAGQAPAPYGGHR